MISWYLSSIQYNDDYENDDNDDNAKDDDDDMIGFWQYSIQSNRKRNG